MGCYIIGIDFGTLSARALLMDARTGVELAQSVYEYPHGVISGRLGGRKLPPAYALQHPGDYEAALGSTVREVLARSGVDPTEVAGVCIDFTTCTLLPLDGSMAPLCFDPRYENEPHAYVKLWKHHGAARYVDQVNAAARRYEPEMLERSGGKLSCEWVFPKVLEVLAEAPELYAATERFAEAGDWLTARLTGREVHSASYAGYKACYDTEHDSYIRESFCGAVDPRMWGIIGTKIAREVHGVCTQAGTVCAYGAALTGLREGTAVAVPMPDAHAAMSALNITEPNTLMMILGTSACHLIHNDVYWPVQGVCGCVKDGVVPGLYTYEAGQPSCGDALDTFLQKFSPAAYAREAEARGLSLHQLYTEKAAALRPGESGLLALDWFNGSRSILDDSDLSGLLLGLTLDTKSEEVYRALIEGLAFGTRTIIENFEAHGVRINRVTASGGIAAKNAMMMQIYADVTGRSISVSGCRQAGARGSALYAAVAAGLYPTIGEAARQLAVPCESVYRPDPERSASYAGLYQEYRLLHRYFGELEPVMHRLKAEK